MLGLFCPLFFLVGRGRRKQADDVLDCILQFWNEYKTTLVKVGNKDRSYLVEVYRSSIGWCGVYLFIANFLLGAQKGAMPFHLVSACTNKKIWASLGLTGLRCLEFAFMKHEPDASLEELQSWFTTLISDQVELLSKETNDYNLEKQSGT